jgi:hypothetical protein
MAGWHGRAYLAVVLLDLLVGGSDILEVIEFLVDLEDGGSSAGGLALLPIMKITPPPKQLAPLSIACLGQFNTTKAQEIRGGYGRYLLLGRKGLREAPGGDQPGGGTHAGGHARGDEAAPAGQSTRARGVHASYDYSKEKEEHKWTMKSRTMCCRLWPLLCPANDPESSTTLQMVDSFFLYF